ncbi:helix-turn-helix domain-containing protein [Fusibacter paucivorans]|nr:helix-turn-helix transcriptional regulator [Fusibacter paucivorans]
MMIQESVGNRIRLFRKSKGMTLQTLGDKIYKSRATVSKYESGAIAIEIGTLYAIADALNIKVEQLLPPNEAAETVTSQSVPVFYKNAARLYAYYYDGRNSSLIRCVIDITEDVETGRFKTMLYMNIKNFEEYLICENTYFGVTEHYDTLSKMILTNQATPIESITISMMGTFADANHRWGLMSGISFRPFMPIALKMYITKAIQKETPEFIRSLKITKEDYRYMKIYNMFSVT